MSKIIYIVTAGNYSAYHIKAVFEDKGLAEKYCEYHTDDTYNECEIEEYTVKTEIEAQPIIEGKIPYEVWLCKDGSLPELFDIRKISWNTYYGKRGTFIITSSYNSYYKKSFLKCFVLANNREHAIKIANEKKAELIAMNKWPNKVETQLEIKSW